MVFRVAEAVIATATQAVETARQLLALSTLDTGIISGLGRAAASTLLVHRGLLGLPISTSGSLLLKTGLTAATVNKALQHLMRLGIVREVTGQRSNCVYSYEGYMEILNRGTGPPDE